MRLFNILNAILQKCIQFSSEKFQDVSLEYTRKLVNNVHSCRRLAISVGGGIENETIYHPPGVNKPHRCRRPVFTDWADPDTVGVHISNHTRIITRGRVVRESAADIFARIFGRPVHVFDGRHRRRLHVIKCAHFADKLWHIDKTHRYPDKINRSCNLLARYRQGLAPERGWAV